MSVKLLIEHLLEFLSLKGDCTSSSESTLVKMSHCWKSHAIALFVFLTGDLVLIHGEIVHKSEKNTSSNSRNIYTFHLFDQQNVVYSKENW